VRREVGEMFWVGARGVIDDDDVAGFGVPVSACEPPVKVGNRVGGRCLVLCLISAYRRRHADHDR